MSTRTLRPNSRTLAALDRAAPTGMPNLTERRGAAPPRYREGRQWLRS